MKTVRINGVDFTVNKKALVARQTWDSIYDVYNRMSYEKERSYKKWLEFWHDNASGDEWLGVQSHNTFQYTIGFTMWNDGVEYRMYITSCNNYCYPIG